MYVELGKIVGVWGVKGWVKLHSYTRHRADIANYPTWYLQNRKPHDEPVPIKVLNCREQGQGVVAQLEGVTDRDQALALNGQRILIDENDLPKLPQGEYYWQQLIGLAVINQQDESMGEVASILETGANDVLVCNRNIDDTVEEVLIPYTDEVVKVVDLEQGTLIVDWDLSYLD